MEDELEKQQSRIPQPDMGNPQMPAREEIPEPQVYQQPIPEPPRLEPIQQPMPEMPTIPQREIIEADGEAFQNSDITNFEYLVKKVEALQEQVELMQKILNQNNLVFKVEARANTPIEGRTMQLLTEGVR